MTTPPQQPGPYGQDPYGQQPGPYGPPGYGPPQQYGYPPHGQPPYGGGPPPKNNIGVIVAVVVAAVLLLGGGGVAVFLLSSDSQSSAGSGDASATATAAEPESSAAADDGAGLAEVAGKYAEAINNQDEAAATSLLCVGVTPPGVMYTVIAPDGRLKITEAPDLGESGTYGTIDGEITFADTPSLNQKAQLALDKTDSGWCVSV